MASHSDTNIEIYKVRPDGSQLTQITHNGVNSRAPNWLPDGTKLLFDRRPAGSADVYVMNPDGSNQINLTNAAGQINETPAWYPTAPDRVQRLGERVPDRSS